MAATRRAEGQYLFGCNVCDYKAKRKDYLQCHIESAHEGKRHACNRCDFTTGHANSLRRHIRITHEGQKLECLLCGCQMGDISNLQRHIKRNHKQSLNNYESLKKYIKYVQGQVEAFECSICEYATTKKSCLKTHLKSSHDVEVN